MCFLIDASSACYIHFTTTKNCNDHADPLYNKDWIIKQHQNPTEWCYSFEEMKCLKNQKLKQTWKAKVKLVPRMSKAISKTGAVSC